MAKKKKPEHLKPVPGTGKGAAAQGNLIPPPKKDRTIHPKALDYIDAKDAHKLAKDAVDTTRDTLIASMKKKGMTVYQCDGVSVELLTSESVKAKMHVEQGDAEE